MPAAPRLALVAGESSGDYLGALLLASAKKQWPELCSFGIGGEKMQAQGFDAWWPAHKLAVFGYVEVLLRYREIIGIRRALLQRLRQDATHRPDIFIGIDAPDFNLQLETELKKSGVKTIHFVSPSIWAWRPERIEKIRAAADHVLCLFPFEPALYAAAGIDATFVGHPFAAHIPMQPDRAAARAALGLASDASVVTLMPGSRASEVKYLAPHFLQAAALVLQQAPQTQFLLPAVPALAERIRALAAGYPALASRLQILDGQSHTALAACNSALIASGTATLEAALFKRPHVIAYRMNPLNWLLIKRKRLQPWVGLPNILCREFVVPEFLQEAVQAPALAAAVLAQLQDTRAQATIAARFIALHQELMPPSADVLGDVLQKIYASKPEFKPSNLPEQLLNQ